jgi:tetratricopeptide (TPR) repeat protein
LLLRATGHPAHNGVMIACSRPRPAAPARHAHAAALLALLALALGGCASAERGFHHTAARDGVAGIGTPILVGSSPAGNYLSGRYALDSGDLAAAKQAFATALAAEPDNLELRGQLFLLQVAAGDKAAAYAAAAELLALDPSAEQALLVTAVERLDAGAWAEAEAIGRQLGRRGVAAYVAPLIRAWARFGQGEPEAALVMLSGAAGEDVVAMLQRRHRAAMLLLAGRTDEAREVMAELRGAGRPLGDGPVLDAAAIEIAAGDRAAAIALIEGEAAAREGDAALETFAAELAGDGPAVAAIRDPRSAVADALYSVAELLFEQRIAGQALVHARLAQFLDPGRADIGLLIGRALLAQGNATAALEAFRAIPARSPYAWEARLATVEAYDALDRKADGTALLRRMVAERAERTDAAVRLGDRFRRDEDYAAAEAAYGEALERLGPARPEHWRLYYARGIARERTGRWSDAERDFALALELEPDQPYVLNYLGYSWVDQKLHLDRATEMLHRAVELRPNDGFIVDSLGWAYYRLGQYDKAVEFLERAIELEPGDPVINDHLGDAYWQVGRLREARYQWQRALTFGPEPAVVAAIEEKLRSGLPEGDPQRG